MNWPFSERFSSMSPEIAKLAKNLFKKIFGNFFLQDAKKGRFLKRPFPFGKALFRDFMS